MDGSSKWSRVVATLEFKIKPPLGPPALRERQLPKDQTAALEEEIIALLQKHAIKKLLHRLALRVCSPQERRGVVPHHQSQVPELLFGNFPVQNGEYQEPEGCDPTRRLHGEVGSTRCISDSPNALISMQVFPLLLEWRGLRISIPPIWTSPSPTPLHKLLKPLLGFLRERGVRIIIYLDDMLILAGESK